MLETRRLILRAFLPVDLEPFAALNADAKVMEYFPSPLAGAESKAMIERIEMHRAQYGFSLYALIMKSNNRFIGFAGLQNVGFEARFTPALEVGWRLAYAYWGQGFAVEAAQAVLTQAFTEIGLDAVVSFTARDNLRSRRVMDKLGMMRDSDGDFDHPNLAEGHWLRPHILYRLDRAHWSMKGTYDV